MFDPNRTTGGWQAGSFSHVARTFSARIPICRWMPGSPTFIRLFEEHRGSVVRYVRRRLGDDAAEDAAVEAFRRAASGRPSEQARYGAARPWLYALATQAVSDRWRTERHRLEALERHAHHPPRRHPALALTRPLDPRVANVLRCLSAADRETLLLIAWGELTDDEAAACLGVAAPVVRHRLGTVHAHVVEQTSDPTGARREPTPAGLVELLAVLADNADLGLDPVRQPRIESAVSRRFAGPPPWPVRAGEPQVLNG
jgi:DNA-directed RNA polymerase specialized sigma24 family protein